jgi:hypothetical protein
MYSIRCIIRSLVLDSFSVVLQYWVFKFFFCLSFFFNRDVYDLFVSGPVKSV